MRRRALDAAGLCCPRCRGPLAGGDPDLSCSACGAAYPIVAGIPDLRVCADPYIAPEDDREKASRLAERGRELGFAGLLDHYYAITPEVPPELARRYREHHLAGARRGGGAYRRLRARFPERGPGPGDRLLDLGCGSGGLLEAAAAGPSAIGVDVALRWLVVAQARLREAGAPDPPLVCACADHLPFREDRFDWIVAENLLEHVADAEAVLREAMRVAAPGGRLMFRSVNRFVPGPEPHVGLWGVGFLPRRWMDPYVRRRRGVGYDKIHLRSAREIARLARRIGANGLEARFPALDPDDYRHLPPLQRRLLGLYRRLGDAAPPLRPALTFFGPFVELAGRLGGSGK